MSKTLIVLVGPTAAGKTSTAIRLARHYHTSIISADSRQFYREMSIGTAKPSTEELALAPHFFIGHISVQEPYNVGMFEAEAMRVIHKLFLEKDVLILTGGSGLYVNAITNGLDVFPDVAPEIRNSLNDTFETQGLNVLLEELRQKDIAYYRQVDLDNPRRVIRALEVIRATGKPFSLFRKNKPLERNFEILKIGLTMDREKLYARINERVDQMFDDGLLEEVRSLLPFRQHSALQTVGYSELFEYLDEKIDLQEAIRLIKRNTRRYAKRQLTWLRKDKEIFWVDAGNKTMEEKLLFYLKP